MLLLAFTLLSAAPPCVEVRQQCRACPTDASLKGCSSVGIACQPRRRVCEPSATDPAPIARAVRRGPDRTSR